MTYPETVCLLVDGVDIAETAEHRPILNPATGDVIGRLAVADKAILDRALAAADRAFGPWKATSPLERSNIIRKTANLLRERVETIALLMTLEQGKPLRESRIETLGAADTLDWFAEEARRTYGRIIPARLPGVLQLAEKVPVGPVAAFGPWNFPLNQLVRKIGAAVAAGCTIIAKGPEETPASPFELARAFRDAGLPPGVLNLVYGDPATISSYLIPHPVIRKVSFTGSTVVGKQLAAMAGAHMKKVTMELGGHGPALVFDDADLDSAVTNLATAKFRNAGQVCVAPTRFIVQSGVHDRFVDGMVAAAEALKVGDGTAAETTMGPLANARRATAIDEMVADAVAQGAVVQTGGRRLGNRGNFYAPTVLTGVKPGMRAMEEEPFGPLVLVSSFDEPEDAFVEANRLPYGLAAYVWTGSGATADMAQARIRSGMLTINHLGLALPETPFGGTGDSGYGSEGGIEAMDGYLETRFVSRRA